MKDYTMVQTKKTKFHLENIGKLPDSLTEIKTEIEINEVKLELL